jgi:hypothetical protein
MNPVFESDILLFVLAGVWMRRPVTLRRLADKEFPESAPFSFRQQGISGSPKLVAEQAKTDQSECSYRRRQEP